MVCSINTALIALIVILVLYMLLGPSDDCNTCNEKGRVTFDKNIENTESVKDSMEENTPVPEPEPENEPEPEYEQKIDTSPSPFDSGDSFATV